MNAKLHPFAVLALATALAGCSPAASADTVVSVDPDGTTWVATLGRP